MRGFPLFASLMLALGMLVPFAAAEATKVCTPPGRPVEACVSAVPSSTTFYYWDPEVGAPWYYTCDPFALVCVLTPTVSGTYRGVVLPWVDTTGTYVKCNHPICWISSDDAALPLP